MSDRVVEFMAASTSDADRREALDAACAAHRSFVLRLALRYGGGDLDWAQDVTQDVLVALCTHFDDLDTQQDLRAWLYRVVTNQCLSRLRRKSLWMRIVRLLPVRHETSTPEWWVGVRDELRQAWSAVESLPPKQRIVLCMVHLDGSSQAEVARILGHSEGYVSKLLARATSRVREAGWEVDDD